jgi:3-methyladenine DNA glycosylase AlkC
MTEEEFWHSNPRTINAYEQAWRDGINQQNVLVHAYVGNYVLSALAAVMNDKNKYIKEPIQLFELTEIDKEKEKDKAVSAFMGWAKQTKSQYNKKGG